MNKQQVSLLRLEMTSSGKRVLLAIFVSLIIIILNIIAVTSDSAYELYASVEYMIGNVD